MYDPEKHSWTFMNARGKKPTPRYLHSAVVVDNAMLVFGGTEKTAGDVWSFSFKKLSWTRLSHVSLLSHGCLMQYDCMMHLRRSAPLHRLDESCWEGQHTCADRSWLKATVPSLEQPVLEKICAQAFCWRQYLHLSYTVLWGVQFTFLKSHGMPCHVHSMHFLTVIPHSNAQLFLKWQYRHVNS